MKIPSRYAIEDDDLDLLRRFTAYIREVAGYARHEYLRKLDNLEQDRYFEQALADTLYYDPMPFNKDEFYFEEVRLSEAFSNLNMLRRRLLTLIFVEGLSAQETADRLGCSVDYVYLQKHRALKALRDQLMDGGDGHGN